jgi:galactoside 2-L-fucosyltransferase 1/2
MSTQGTQEVNIMKGHSSRLLQETANTFSKKNRHQRYNVGFVTDRISSDNIRGCPFNITIQTPGRIGNLMFAYASLIGIARKLNRTVVIDKENPLRLFFKLTAEPIDTKRVNLSSWEKFEPFYSAAFERRIFQIPCRDNLLLSGYFQSWKYFEDIQKTIRKEFTFKDLIRQKATEFLQNSIKDSYGPNITREDVVIIGIHVRRSDMTDYESRQRGYIVASKEYIKAAMAYMQVQYKRIVFVICSDDLFWVRQNVKSDAYPVVYAENFHAILDLAILTLCDHTIMTVGSFGWWGAYLAGGKTVYVNDFPRKYSALDNEYSVKDYFYPGWRGLPSGTL